MQFREFVDEQEHSWKAKKKDILALWQSLRPGLPLHIDPIPAVHKGSRYDDDGLRITGSADFISSVMSRLKDMLTYEVNPGTKLDISYEQITSKDKDPYQKPRYVCYIHVVQREVKIA